MIWLERAGGRTMSAMYYLAIGALLHTALIGITFNPASLASWGVLIAWPIVLLVLLFLTVFFLFLAVVGLLWVWDTVGALRRA
jgi:hypothetical protein